VLTTGIYLMLLSKGCDSIDREQINSWDFAAKVAEAKKAIPKQVAEVWLEMNRKGCLPAWAIAQVKPGSMEKAAI
jgi:hypothetical protein